MRRSGLSGLSDEQLVAMAREGDQQAFAAVVRRYEGRLFRYLKRLLGKDGAGEDILQEVFIKAYRNLHGFDVRRSFSAWIYRIAHNEGVNYLKKSRRYRTTPFDAVRHRIKGTGETPYAQLQRDQLQRMLRLCLDKLPPKYRGPLILYYFEGKQYKQISEILRVPTNTVGTLISRGKKYLRDICRGRMEQENG